MTLDPICSFLRDERKNRGLSLEDVGVMMGRTQGRSTIWQWESGTNMPVLKNAREWAEALGYEIVLIPLPEEVKKEEPIRQERRKAGLREPRCVAWGTPDDPPPGPAVRCRLVSYHQGEHDFG